MPPANAAIRDEHGRQMVLQRRWWIAALLLVAGLSNYLDRIIISVALPIIAADLHLGPARMGVLLSAFFWSYALMQIPVGWLSDRFNLRWFYAACFAWWSITCGLTGLAGNLTILLIFRVLLGIGESIHVPGSMKIVSVLFPPEARGLASGLVNSGTRAGLAFGAPLIAMAVVGFGWRISFYILGAVSLLWLVPWFACFPRTATTVSRQEPAVPRSGWRLDRRLLGMSLAHIGYGYYFYLMVTWLPTYFVQSRRLAIEAAGLYTMVPYLTFTLAEPIGGWLADRLVAIGWDEIFSRKLIITASYLSSILLIPAGRVEGVGACVSLLGGASLVGLSSGNIFALVQRISPGKDVGFSMGVLNLAGNISGVVAPLVTGLIVERTGSYSAAFAVAVVVLLSVVPLYWWMVKTGPRGALY